MCSVVGYVGKGQSRDFVMEGLIRLEYRGYDSAGFACLQDKRLLYAKSQGGVENLLKKFKQAPIDGSVGVGHTRWSTHGAVSTANAHPHVDCRKKISLVHNGIIENYHEIKLRLIKEGHRFQSETDTETIVHLCESLLAIHKDLKKTMIALVNQLKGAYALAIIFSDFPDLIVVVRKRSPLCLGSGEDAMFVASDLLAFAGKTNKMLFLPDESFAIVRAKGIELYDFQGNSLPAKYQIVDIPYTADLKKGYAHFMLKEIYDQKKVIQDTVFKYRAQVASIWKQMDLCQQEVIDLKHLRLIGCGTSWHAGLVAKFFFEEIAKVRVDVLLASEMRAMAYFPERKSISIGISQSGETADTLEALRFLNKHKNHTVALVNVPSSTMVRETTGYLPLYAGPEIAVASTKAFTAQLSALYWLAHKLAYDKCLIKEKQLKDAENELLVVAELLENAIEQYKRIIIKKYAPYYAQFRQALFIGRHISYPFAREASLKLKEISYIFTDCVPAGELKHGTLALVDKDMPVFIFSVLDPEIYQKLLCNAQEVKARSGHIVAFAFEGQDELINLADTVFILPTVSPLLGPLLTTGLMQFFFYHIAKVLERPIDKPRNLAKSVTVE